MQSLLSYPLSGITYIEISGTLNSTNINGSGILIVHNTNTNAIIKTPSGTFTRLVIADDIDRVHGTIISALVAMSPSHASGNCIGNGIGNIYYSSKAIKNASSTTGNSGSSDPPYVGRYRLQIYSWLGL